MAGRKTGKREAEHLPGDLSPEVRKCLDFDQVMLTCRRPDGQWLYATRFEGYTGFKPTRQQDSTKELMKSVVNAVREMDNSRVEGLRLLPVGPQVDPYTRMSTLAVADPRGFFVMVPTPHVIRLLAECGGNIDDWTLPGEYIYLNDMNLKQLVPVLADGEIAKSALAWTDADQQRRSLVRSNDIKPGCVYTANSAFPPGRYMFIGRFDTFNARSHITAWQTGRYPVLDEMPCGKSKPAGSVDYKFPRLKNAMTFCRLDVPLCNSRRIYYPRKSATKMFFADESGKAAPALHDAELDVRTSLGFHAVDFSRSPVWKDNLYRLEGEIDAMPPGLFRYLIDKNTPHNQTECYPGFPVFGLGPYEKYGNLIFMTDQDGRSIFACSATTAGGWTNSTKINVFSLERAEKTYKSTPPSLSLNDTRYQKIWRGIYTTRGVYPSFIDPAMIRIGSISSVDLHDETALKALYDKVRPGVPRLILDNGMATTPDQAAGMVHFFLTDSLTSPDGGLD